MARTAKKRTVKRTKKVTRRRRKARKTAAADPQTALKREIEQYRLELVARRQQIDSQIMAFDRAIKALNGGASGTAAAARAVTRGPAKPGRRSATKYRPNSLKDYITRVLGASGKVMRVKEITQGVLKAGYKTKNKSLSTSVGLALADMPNVKKVGHGKYRLK